MGEYAGMAIRAGAELTLSLLQRTMWSDILLYSSLRLMEC